MKKLSINIILSLLFINVFSQGFDINKVDFSTDYNEFSPYIFQNKLLFCSDRKNTLVKTITDSVGKYLTDIYFIDLNDTSNHTPKLFSSGITTPFNEGPFCFSPDGKTIYYTRNIHLFVKTKDIEKKRNNLGIFIATKTDTGWSNVQEFEYNNEKYNVAHPAISTDGKTLFFVSDMPNGSGGSDIYYCTKKGSKWSAPKNLGNIINSSGNEFFLYFHPYGRLYFASDREGGKGGLDIYYTEIINNQWQKPVHLDVPFNSHFDDFGYISDQSFENGYFSRNTDGNDDILKFNYRYPKIEKCDSMQKPELCYDLYEENALKSDSIPLDYEWDFGDGTKARGAEVHHCFEKAGNYIVKLNVINKVSGEITYNDATYELNIEDFIQPYINCEDSIYIEKSLQLSATTEKLIGFQPSEFFWNFGDGQKSRGQNIEHIFSSEGNFKVNLTVLGKDKDGNKKKYCVFKWVYVF